MKYSLAELIDLPQLQQLMETLYKATGINHALIDNDSMVHTAAGWQEICTQFHRVNPKTCARCLESDRYILAHIHEGPYVGYRCPQGLVDYATPVVIEGEHVANIFTGQMLHEPPDIEFFRRQAKEFCFDEEAYLAALKKVPVIPRERIQDIMAFQVQLAQMLARSGLTRLRQLQAEGHLEEINLGLRHRTEELEAANKELEDFSYSVSHDLRSPLRAIVGFSQILEEDFGARLDDEGRRLLGVVRDNGLRMGKLIDGILRFLQLGRQPLRPAAVDMAALAREVFAEVAPPARPVRFIVGELPAAQGDPALLREVLANLLSNAVKFTSPKAAAQIEVGGEAGAAENAYFVRDNGIGFDMRYADKLFHVFERLHAEAELQGAGVGLAVVKRIVHRHGGSVRAEGRVGEGATIHFTLPAKETDHER